MGRVATTRLGRSAGRFFNPGGVLKLSLGCLHPRNCLYLSRPRRRSRKGSIHVFRVVLDICKVKKHNSFFFKGHGLVVLFLGLDVIDEVWNSVGAHRNSRITDLPGEFGDLGLDPD